MVEGGSGAQPQLFEMHVPPSQPPQSIGSPQLSVVLPQRPAHHTGGATGVQQEPETQTSLPEQEQLTACPQTSVRTTPHWLPQVTLGGGGEQQVPPSASQMSVGCSQLGVPATPQATIWPQLFTAVPQFWMPHVIETESGTQAQPPLVQVRPPSQEPQLTGLPQLSRPGPQRLSQ